MVNPLEQLRECRKHFLIELEPQFIDLSSFVLISILTIIGLVQVRRELQKCA